MKTILVPIDFSPAMSDILRTTTTLAKALKARVILLNLIQAPIVSSDAALPAESLRDAVLALEKAATSRLDRLTAKFRRAKVPCRGFVREGPPVTLILDEAKRIRADYILIASHGHGKLYDLLVGSTASGVLQRAPCAVIIIPPRGRRNSPPGQVRIFIKRKDAKPQRQAPTCIL